MSRTRQLASCFMLLPVAGALVRSEQSVRNAVYPGTRSGYAASGRCTGRSGS